MTLSPRLQFGLLGVALVALVLVVFLGREGPPPGDAPRLTSATPPPTPSADNVAPSFHAQLMTLQEAVEEAPADTARLLALARFQQDGHQLAEAADTYERVLAVAPEHRQAHLDLALVYAELGRPADARRITEALLDRYPDDPSGRYNLGALHANAGDYDEARRLWDGVAAQADDPSLAAQARASLDQLDALSSAPARPAPSPGALPAGHPPLPGLEPVMVEK